MVNLKVKVTHSLEEPRKINEIERKMTQIGKKEKTFYTDNNQTVSTNPICHLYQSNYAVESQR